VQHHCARLGRERALLIVRRTWEGYVIERPALSQVRVPPADDCQASDAGLSPKDESSYTTV
jgi:hypothetical protein